MKSGGEAPELDAIDLQILSILQEHGRISHVKLGEQVGLSAPSVIDRDTFDDVRPLPIFSVSVPPLPPSVT